ncbi:diaminopimelate decarboxylase [Sulfobacillus thermosulfidooxidans]|uniref:diaminopimelate decarboxylase n=1 Tax=Sulfobacillus thermosulfidooxidans TaxID=28034 RepID=UPI0003FF4656|nr:diaminopimelate decarboxylase [Sulfobacillus thermosulfidooxidans]
MFPDTYQRDEFNRISIGGVPVRQLAEAYGTPLYVLDYATMLHRIHAFQEALNEMTPPGRAFYAGKAFLTTAMAGFLNAHGMGLDVVSGGELYTAIAAGFDMQNIVFHGNVKTAEEIQLALEHNVGYVVVDSLDELHLIDEIAARMSIKAPVLLRLTPGIEAHTHAFIQTGQFDSKFGFGMKDGIHEEAVSVALASSHIDLKGFHAHIGSQIFDEDPFVHNAMRLMEFIQSLWEQRRFWPEVLDIGGGFGVQYTHKDDPPEVPSILARVNQAVQALTPRECEPPVIFIEPGRAIVAEAGVTVYQVNATKTVPGGKNYIAVDGGMGDNIRPALYQAEYVAQVDGKPIDGVALYTLAGRYCESGDILIRDVALPPVEVGDYVVVFGTGAYNYAMSSNYNRVPKPAVVLVADGHSQLWVKRETYQDLVAQDLPWRDPAGLRDFL